MLYFFLVFYTRQLTELLTEPRIATSDEGVSLDKTDYSIDLLDSLTLPPNYLDRSML